MKKLETYRERGKYYLKSMINKNNLLETFIELIKIDSPSGEEEKVSNYLVNKLEKLGFQVQKDKFGNVIGSLPGEGEAIMLNAHMDTVEPGRGIKPKVEKDIVKSNGSTILGGDPKAGGAAILEALSSVVGKKHLPIEVVFTREEESSLGGAMNLDYSLLKSKRGVTFDGEAGVENITISAPGYNRFDLIIIGRSAHAGAEPEKGISAIKIASEIISKLKLGRIDHETTTNIGLIEGGSARNAVPEKVHIKGEIRSRNLKKLEKLSLEFQKVIDNTFLKYPDAHFELDLHREFDPYLFKEEHRVIAHISQILKSMGLKPKLEHSGGGTDVNIFHTNGVEAICVGVGVYEAHTTREYVKIDEMLKVAEFAEKLLTFGI